jgi:hypothetical protein
MQECGEGEMLAATEEAAVAAFVTLAPDEFGEVSAVSAKARCSSD